MAPFVRAYGDQGINRILEDCKIRVDLFGNWSNPHIGFMVYGIRVVFGRPSRNF